MPYGDGTGPYGTGRMGRGFGPCGRGQGRCAWGSFPGNQAWSYGVFPYRYPPPMDKTTEKTLLERQLQALEQTRSEIENRIKELEK